LCVQKKQTGDGNNTIHTASGPGRTLALIKRFGIHFSEYDHFIDEKK
jgi:hypothetical protein